MGLQRPGRRRAHQGGRRARGHGGNVLTQPARNGLAAGIGAFVIWGALPLYLRPLHSVPPLTVVCHRLVWCCFFVGAWLFTQGRLGRVVEALRHPPTRWRLMASATLISVNWLVYVWAVASGHVIDSSLGYFINPLINVLLGVLVFRESLGAAKRVAVGLAALGVAWLTWQAGHLPWISLALALSFSAYGAVRKVVQADALTGLAAETLLLAPMGIGWITYETVCGMGAFGGATPGLSLWMVAGGLVTAVPLALFALAARSIAYSTVGVLQYIAPSMQLGLGVVLFGEPFPPGRAVGFAFIWAALVVYAAQGLRGAGSAGAIRTAGR